MTAFSSEVRFEGAGDPMVSWTNVDTAWSIHTQVTMVSTTAMAESVVINKNEETGGKMIANLS